MDLFFSRAVQPKATYFYGLESFVAFSVQTLLPYSMSTLPPKSKLEKPSDGDPPRRIQTQIHRRNKAKAVYPMTDEWENSQDSPPKGLKRPPEDMSKKK